MNFLVTLYAFFFGNVRKYKFSDKIFIFFIYIVRYVQIFYGLTMKPKE